MDSQHLLRNRLVHPWRKASALAIERHHCKPTWYRTAQNCFGHLKISDLREGLTTPFKKSMKQKRVGGWTNPFEKYVVKMGTSPGGKTKNIWNHQLVEKKATWRLLQCDRTWNPKMDGERDKAEKSIRCRFQMPRYMNMSVCAVPMPKLRKDQPKNNNCKANWLKCRIEKTCVFLLIQ